MIDPSKLDSLRTSLADFRNDTAARAKLGELLPRRKRVVSEMRPWLQRFLDGELDVESLRSDFDRRTRTEWDGFGLKGLSGAMFLNKLVKHYPEPERLAAELRAALPVPASEEEGRAKMDAMRQFLRDSIEEGTVSKRDITPGRLPFFLSAMWHIQDPDAWPVFYPATRYALGAAGIHAQGEDRVEDYFAVRQALLELTEKLGGVSWETDQFLKWNVTPPPSPQPGPEVVEPEIPEPARRVWLVATGEGAKDWAQQLERRTVGIWWSELGDLRKFRTYERLLEQLERARPGRSRAFQARQRWQFAHVMKPGDVVIVKQGRRRVVGIGWVRSDYRYDESVPGGPNLRDVEWARTGDERLADNLPAKRTLTEISADERLRDKIYELFDFDPAEENGGGTDPPVLPPYSIEVAGKDLFVERETLEEWLELLRRKKNLVQQGPPGVGKTFVARRLAYLLAGVCDRERVEIVQFHPSYSYEDFIQGYRPKRDGGFELRDGPFLKFCTRAGQVLEEPHVLIVDEINRGNLSKIFGELMMLIEHDKRHPDWGATLAYGTGESRFHVPANVHLIGTMNTADRSLALVDYALRRRFSFVDVEPGFATDAFADHLRGRGAEEGVVKLVRGRLDALNGLIRSAPGLGSGFEIGHSYFCAGDADTELDDAWFERIARSEVLPLLREYWFDDDARFEQACSTLLDEE